jgi:predicted Fe-Mo cluster-binding NifX family protein
MKTLIATEGNTLDSCVARRFERAGWYLIVDDTMNILGALHHAAPRDYHKVLVKAAQENIGTVVAGKIGFGSLQIMASFDLKAAFARGMSARGAIDMLSAGELKAFVIQEKKSRPRFTRRQNPSNMHGSSPVGALRSEHHLQQYSGRGH